ncbi:olfactory receptor 7G3-like [Thomomys bottae]
MSGPTPPSTSVCKDGNWDLNQWTFGIISSILYTISGVSLKGKVNVQQNRTSESVQARQPQNGTRVSEFHLLGLSEDPDLQPFLFGLFLSMYLITVLGNLLIILAVTSDPHLHTPMYFFLSNLSFVDICFTSTTIPKCCLRNQDMKGALGRLHSNVITNPSWIFDLKTTWKLWPLKHILCPIHSEADNLTCVWEFLLLGLSQDPELQSLLLVLFLTLYLVTMLGNLLIILAVGSDPHLHTPMYFFLSILSLADLGFSNSIVSQMLTNLQTHSKSISYAGCLTQVFFSVLFGCLESLLLGVMAYDRLVAICHPLHYQVIMHPRLCGGLVLVTLLFSLLDAQMHCSMVSHLTFCMEVVIPHFFCEASQLLTLACSDISSDSILIYVVSVVFGGVPVLGIFYSYTRIVTSIMKIPSRVGKYKAFSTCGSHLSVVGLFYGTTTGIYLASAISQSPRMVAVVAVIYTVVTPLLNPFIYSLRNRDIKRALLRILRRLA